MGSTKESEDHQKQSSNPACSVHPDGGGGGIRPQETYKAIKTIIDSLWFLCKEQEKYGSKYLFQTYGHSFCCLASFLPKQTKSCKCTYFKPWRFCLFQSKYVFSNVYPRRVSVFKISFTSKLCKFTQKVVYSGLSYLQLSRANQETNLGRKSLRYFY